MKVAVEQMLGIIREFVREREGTAPKIDAETALLREGVIDSFALVDLIAEIEKKLGVDLPMGTLIPEDFETTRVLCARLEQI